MSAAYSDAARRAIAFEADTWRYGDVVHLAEPGPSRRNIARPPGTAAGD